MSRLLPPAFASPPACRPASECAGARDSLADEEWDFYQGYPWCLNPYPTVRETAAHLGAELERLGKVPGGWQAGEVLTNVYLLSCALLNAVDDYLRGKTFRLPKKAPALPFARQVGLAAEKLAAMVPRPRRARARRWRQHWLAGLDALAPLLLAAEPPGPAARAAAGDRLADLLRSPLPATLQEEQVHFPSAFRKHDLTHKDVVALGRRFLARFPDRRQPVLVTGLRTAGSYFAPLLRAFLAAEGCAAVEVLTVRPDRGPGPAERQELVRRAREGYRPVILDDSPRTGDTIVLAVDATHRAGFPPDRVVVLAPVHPASRDWRRNVESLPLAGTAVLTLEEPEWHKRGLLAPEAVQGRLREYYESRQFSDVRLVDGPAAREINARLHSPPEDPRRARLKRVYEVRMRDPWGREETRFVLAKSVGWGWLGYHAYLAGRRLAGFVPPVLGLRDGILYTEWLPQRQPVGVPPSGGLGREEPPEGGTPTDRQEQIRTAASYVAARVRFLGLGKDPVPMLGLHPHHDSIRLLDRVLSGACGTALTAQLLRPRIRRRLAAQPCPCPTLIDGKMDCPEWVAGPAGLLKTDFEHHGMGKNERNLADPAGDLAETILRLELSPEEEEQLLRTYAEESGDAGVGQRLFVHKLFAGTWATAAALKGLFRDPPLTDRQQEFHRQFTAAWHFLTVHAARHCGAHCRPPRPPRWCSQLVVLDLDGVLDRRLFGFPCTTAAGIEALALLHEHDFAVAVDTARSVPEVKEYCRAYGFAGGVAEYGSYVWDAVEGRGRVVVSPESLDQLGRLRVTLERLPGVFLDDRYQYSVRAHTYEDRPAARSLLSSLCAIRESPYEGRFPVPLPTLTVRHLLASLGLDRLCVRQTGIDTTVVAREVDKGEGLLALLALAGLPAADTIAVGDSEADLAMFRVAARCFAPAQIGCARLARRLGCRIARHRYQRGLLDVARTLVHPGVGRCRRCPGNLRTWRGGGDLFLDLLEAADRSRPAMLLRALLDPRAYRAFLR
jgi:hydroxymethylpyrimidine pyrophosphatase-like HAD family hydrolase